MINLIDFLNDSPLSFHAASNIVSELTACGYSLLAENTPWHLVPGGKYMVTRNGSSVIAFTLGESPNAGFDIALSHLDSPGLRLKMHSLHQSAGVLVAPVERYSMNIDSTWLDQPLTIAGRVVTTALEERLIHFAEQTAIIPNLAIHLNREANKGVEYNPQTQLSAVLGAITPEEFRDAIAMQAGCSAQDIAEMELGLAVAESAAVVGLKRDLIVSARLDNLLAAHAMLAALCDPSIGKRSRTAVGFFADNEEIGSGTPQGADSCFLRDTLERLSISAGGTREDFFIALAGSHIISVDAAHAIHPNYPERYDATTSPVINHGIVLKSNANGRYATNSATAAWLERLCADNDIPLQRFAIRSDLPCGSTVGPMTARRLGCPTVDIGSPMWAMHSVRETAGLKDQAWMTRLLIAFFRE